MKPEWSEEHSARCIKQFIKDDDVAFIQELRVAPLGWRAYSIKGYMGKYC